MGVLSSLVPKAQPALADSGAKGGGSTGATWSFPATGVVDNNGTAIDLSGCTGVCKVVDLANTVVATLVFAGANNGTFTLTLDESVTATIAPGTLVQPRECRWYLTITDTVDVVQMWHPGNSPFEIFPGS